jgi:hypothetical protein
MATGQSLFSITASDYMPPSTIAAVPATRNTTNPLKVLEFVDTIKTVAIFLCVMPRTYSAATGITARLLWSSAATSGNAKWDIEIDKVIDGTTDITADSFDTVNTVTVATTATANVGDYDDIAIVDANLDGVAGGDTFRLKLSRDAADAADTINSNSCDFVSLEVRET